MDGITHINCYSKGKTELGRSLTNFAFTPFEIDGLKFNSVEGWWYYQNTPDIRLCSLSGWKAKQLGQQLQKDNPTLIVQPITREHLKRVYQAKLQSNPDLLVKVKTSTLTFDHYYEYSGKRVETKWQWTGQLWNEIREELNNANKKI